MKEPKQRAETSPVELVRKEKEKENMEGKNAFFACYLLCSLCPRYKGHTYIGFTNNPRRRIRQHNGEIRCGAWRTKHKRPWEMILCIYGFPSKISALQFEWAWQHPKESLAVRKAAASFRSLSGIENKIKLAYTMLTLPQWERLNLIINFFSTKYLKHSAQCPKLPKHMKIYVHAMDELPCYMDKNFEDDYDDDDGIDNDNNDNGTGDSGPPCDSNVSTSTGTSMDGPLENSCQRNWELCDLLHQEGNSNYFFQQREPSVSFGFIRPSKFIDEMNRTKNGVQSALVFDCDDLFIPGEDLHGQAADSPCRISASVLHVNEEKPSTHTGNTLLSCGNHLCESVNVSNPTHCKAFSPRTAKCGAAHDTTQWDVIDLSTPSTCKARSIMRRSPISVEIIDLVDSPM